MRVYYSQLLQAPVVSTENNPDQSNTTTYIPKVTRNWWDNKVKLISPNIISIPISTPNRKDRAVGKWSYRQVLQTAMQLEADEFEFYKMIDKTKKSFRERKKELVDNCPHPNDQVRYQGDPSGGSDSSYHCDLCGQTYV